MDSFRFYLTTRIDKTRVVLEKHSEWLDPPPALPDWWLAKVRAQLTLCKQELQTLETVLEDYDTIKEKYGNEQG